MGGGAGVFFATLRERLPEELRPRVQDLLETLETGLSRGQFHTEELERLFSAARDVLSHYESHDSR
jgi:hypothetical protein